MRFSKLSKRFGPILGARYQVPVRIYSERQAIRIAVSDPKKLWTFQKRPPDRRSVITHFGCLVVLRYVCVTIPPYFKISSFVRKQFLNIPTNLQIIYFNAQPPQKGKIYLPCSPFDQCRVEAILVVDRNDDYSQTK